MAAQAAHSTHETSEKCRVHPGTNLSYFCEKCHSIICEDCHIHGSHKGHPAVLLTDMRKQIKDLKNEAAHDVYLNRISFVEIQVKKEISHIVEEVEKKGKAMTSKLRELRENELERFISLQNVLEGNESSEKKYVKLKEIGQGKIISADSGRLHFIHFEQHVDFLTRAIGRLEWVADSQNITELCSFKLPESTFVRSIRPINSSKAWILQNGSKKIHLVDHHGSCLETIDLEEPAEDFCLFNDDIFFTVWGGAELRKKTRGTTPILLHAFHRGYFTKGLCSFENDVFVCLASVEKGKESQIAKLSIRGKIASEVPLEHTKYFRPGRIAYGIQNIAVVDWRDGRREVKFVNQQGRLVWSWTGRIGNEQQNPFVPFDINLCCEMEEEQYLVTANMGKDSKVYAVNLSTKSAKCIYRNDSGHCNAAIATDTAGHIWIGGQFGQVHVMKVI